MSEDYRDTSHARWERAARGWGARRAQLQRSAAPVSQWLLGAVEPQPGETVLELAAGPADTGLMAAELVRPGGTLICTDFSEAMLEQARARAAELGLDNVEFRPLDAESLDLDAASVDAVLCRWGYMLMADPGAALSETRRVLRPGGRLALAAWAGPEENEWASVPSQELVRAGLAEAPEPGSPGMFAFAAPGRIEELLADAGFLDVEVADVAFEQRFDSFDDWWETTLDLSAPFAQALEGAAPEVVAKLRTAIEERLAPHRREDATVVVPARTLVAAASA